MKHTRERTQSTTSCPCSSPSPNTIASYLADPVIRLSTIKEAGGIMKYWHQDIDQRPRLAKMRLDFCSAPVDAECAFSVGRLEINHLQHNTSPQTFKAQVAVGSWAKTPLYPGLSETIKIVQKQMGSEEQVGPQKEVDETELEDELEETDEESRFWRT
ncbi:hypothetical protein L208DRAFT_1392897 [Tricholoma matsutake]|nr:hypothetical protein L208DRAFT_1392897 [Tricholoma matsutake 945]